MALSVYNYGDGRGDRGNRLLSCPLCGHEFDRQERPPQHFADEHGPGDCPGVTPLGERPRDADRPLFDEPEEVFDS